MLQIPLRITRIIIAAVGLLLVLRFLVAVRAVFAPFLFGFILAYLFDPLVDQLERWKISRRTAIIIVYLVLAAFLLVLVFYVLPVMFRDLNKIAEAIPGYSSSIQKMLWDLQDDYDRVPIPEGIRQIVDDTIANVSAMVLSVIEGLVRGLVVLFSQAFNIILAPVLSYYFLKEFNKLGFYVLEWLPARLRPEITQIGLEINQVIKRFIRGNLLVASLVGLMAATGMALIGMDFPLLIGILVGVTNFIPYFGAFISAVPAIMLALLKSKWMALYVLGVILVIQQVEGNIISPKILGESVGLHPLFVIFALLAGGKLWGLTGLLIAVPLAAVIRIMCRHLYLRLL